MANLKLVSEKGNQPQIRVWSGPSTEQDYQAQGIKKKNHFHITIIILASKFVIFTNARNFRKDELLYPLENIPCGELDPTPQYCSHYCSHVQYLTSRGLIKHAAAIKQLNCNEGEFYRRRGEREETGIS
jgi:hypothetical protein